MRRRRNAPVRGEWVDVYPLDEPVLPEAPDDWSPRAKRLWEAWRADPVTSLWTSADTWYARDLAECCEMFKPNEQRLRMDGLGLTPKGKRDLRWRIVEDDSALTEPVAFAQPLARLRVTLDDANRAAPVAIPDPRAA